MLHYRFNMGGLKPAYLFIIYKEAIVQKSDYEEH